MQVNRFAFLRPFEFGGISSKLGNLIYDSKHETTNLLYHNPSLYSDYYARGAVKRKATVDVLKRIIPKLKSHAYRFVTLTELTKSKSAYQSNGS